MMVEVKKFWRIEAVDDKTGELHIYGAITSYKWDKDDPEVTAKEFKEDLDALGDIDILNLYINSPGGLVFQAQTIYSILKRHKAHINVYVDGLAASSASLIAMAGDTIIMPENAMMMIHNPSTCAWGTANELRKQADTLDKVRESMIVAYLAKAGDNLSEEELIKLLDAETWLTAQECYDYGLCDVLEEEKQVAACVNEELFAQYKNVPEQFKLKLKGEDNIKEEVERQLQKQNMQGVKNADKGRSSLDVKRKLLLLKHKEEV